MFVRVIGVGAFAARWQAMRLAALRTADAYWRAAHGARAERSEPSERGEHVEQTERTERSEHGERGERPDVRVVAAGLEPSLFTDLFDTWTDHDLAAEANIAVSIIQVFSRRLL